MDFSNLKKFDPEIYGYVMAEKDREMDGLELIPSENLPSLAVLEALGSYPNNKYAEGYPGKRYYGGNEFIDQIEGTAIARAKKLFGAEYVNVQPYSGSPANAAVYLALLEFHDTLMGMRLDMGGHLTHGHKVSYSGKAYNAVQYTVDEKTELINYDEVRKLAHEAKPRMLIAGFSAYPRALDFKQFREIADEVGAYAMADIAHISGLCATGLHPNPLKDGFDVVTTTTHKMLRGPRGAMIMAKPEFGEKIDKAIFPGFQGGPHEHAIAAMAVCFKEALLPDYKKYCQQIVKNAQALADELMKRGYRLVTGGTDNHLMLVDLRSQNLTGLDGEKALEAVGIYCNKNAIPFDPRKPWDPSGIRVGTPVLTTRGMKESEMHEVGRLIDLALKKKDQPAEQKRVAAEVKALCGKFGYYQ